MTETAYEIRERVLAVGEPQAVRYTVQFDSPIAEVLDFDGVMVVRTRPTSASNENVYGISADGRIIWKVGSRRYAYEQSPYTAIRREGANVRLFNWDGLELIVDPSTGRELSVEYGK